MSKILEITEHKKYYGGMSLVERMKECHTTAISIAIIDDYKIVDLYSHGVKRRTAKDKVNAETLFQAASISKPVFAVAVMRLAESGKLDLDADINDYLDDIEIPQFDGKRHKFTLRQILSHHAGLNLHGFAGYQQGQKIPTLEQILKGESPTNIIKLKLEAEPGEAFSYSGGGYLLAQKIVTEICNQDFEDIMRELVFSPFGMPHSTYAQPLPKSKRDDVAFGYNFYNLQLPGGYNIMPEQSAAGLWTTPSDLAHFGIEMMKAVNGESVFLKKNTAELMITKVDADSPTGQGFFADESKKGIAFKHSGANYGYYSNMCFCPSDGSGLVVMVNSDIGAMIPEEVTKAFKDVYGW